MSVGSDMNFFLYYIAIILNLIIVLVHGGEGKYTVCFMVISYNSIKSSPPILKKLQSEKIWSVHWGSDGNLRSTLQAGR